MMTAAAPAAHLPVRRRKYLVRGLAALFAAAVASGTAVLGAGWLYRQASLPPSEATVRTDLVSAAVTVLRDRFGVPHIFAQSLPDAAFALGYTHAEDRLWQMEAMRRLAAGRLAELLGPSALPSDRFMRTLGLRRLAEGEHARLTAETARLLASYAAGVNSRLNAAWWTLPPEFLLLRHRPEPWSPVDSLLWFKLMALDLGRNSADELMRARLQGRLSPQQLRDLWPEAFSHGDDSREHDIRAFEPVTTAGLPPAPAITGASNAWAVSGRFTAGGSPILANDPHLRLTAPIQWYLSRIETPELALAGATVAGVPLLVLGHNGHIAWGLTSAEVDVEDLFVERLDASGSRYRTPEGWEPVLTRRETITVRGAEAESLQVRETRHGPLIADVLERKPDLEAIAPSGGDAATATEQRALALAATLLQPDDKTVEAVARANLALDEAAFLSTHADFDAPAVNLVYADTVGNIGYSLIGRIPVRRRRPGALPAPGWTGEADWVGWMAAADKPSAFNPEAGVIVKANDRPVAATDARYLGEGWESDFRARRIRQLLSAGPPATVNATGSVQLDAVSLASRDLLPLLLAELPAADRALPPVRLLASWSGIMARDRPEPLIAMAWLTAIDRALFADEIGPDFDAFWRFQPDRIRGVFVNSRAWCDDIGTEPIETCRDIVGGALHAAISALGGTFGDDPATWRWGEAHHARFRHRLFESLPPAAAGLVSPAIATDGGADTINRGAFAVNDPHRPFAHVHGAGYRAVYDLGDLSRSRFVIAPGQSGHPLSPHYADLLPTWRDGGWLTLDRPRQALERDATTRLVILPLTAAP